MDVGNDAYDAVPWLSGRRRVFGDEADQAHVPYCEDWGVGGGIVDERQQDRDDAVAVRSLADHRDHVLRVGEELFSDLGLRPEIRHDLLLAIELHDVGKAEFGFQVLLHGGDEIAAAAKDAVPRAKGGVPWWNVAARNRARQASGLKKGWRHELESVRLLDGERKAELDRAHDRELVRHLVASHHGRGRPWIPSDNEIDPIVQANGFWRLIERYGPWGLAYLEALMRVADRRASREHESASDHEKETAS